MSEIYWVLHTDNGKEYTFKAIQDNLSITSNIDGDELDYVWDELDKLITLA